MQKEVAKEVSGGGQRKEQRQEIVAVLAQISEAPEDAKSLTPDRMFLTLMLRLTLPCCDPDFQTAQMLRDASTLRYNSSGETSN